MVKIVIENLGKKEVPVNDFEHPVLHYIQSAFVDWMHACGGKGRCTTCTMIVRNGEENLAPLTTAEERYRQLGALAKNERLACQARIIGTICIAVPDEYKLPHMTYTGLPEG